MSVAALSLLVLGLAVGIGVFGARAVGAVTVVDSLLSGYVVTFGVVVLLVLGLSLAHALTTAALLMGLVGVLFAAGVIARLRSRSGCASVRGFWRGALATARSEPLLAPLFALVAGTVAYSIALAICTPPTNWDSLTYHLARIGFWLQQGSVSYIGNAYNEALNGYPPNGEIGQLLVFRTTGDERLMGLVQLVAAVMCAVGVYGLARRLARPRPEAAFGAGLFLTLPVVLLGESTTQNDLIVASLLVSASFFLAGPSRRDHVVAALAVGLAMGTKVTGILCASDPHRPRARRPSCEHASRPLRGRRRGRSGWFVLVRGQSRRDGTPREFRCDQLPRRSFNSEATSPLPSTSFSTRYLCPALKELISGST